MAETTQEPRTRTRETITQNTIKRMKTIIFFNHIRECCKKRPPFRKRRSLPQFQTFVDTISSFLYLIVKGSYLDINIAKNLDNMENLLSTLLHSIPPNRASSLLPSLRLGHLLGENLIFFPRPLFRFNSSPVNTNKRHGIVPMPCLLFVPSRGIEPRSTR